MLTIVDLKYIMSHFIKKLQSCKFFTIQLTIYNKLLYFVHANQIKLYFTIYPTSKTTNSPIQDS